MIRRAATLLASAVMAGVALVFAVGWFSAVPRFECQWGQDFCSDYGPLYGGLAIASLALSVLFLLVFRTEARK
ncbi:hypothetical protein P8Q88_10450 [Qipengyuania sp. XHP0207]|uniref:hypothetical protein n=1 Tax=Qipengyuania sp. XHP0207 TaxID=3038078 RepID=UPI00241CAF16|nr:hypothetical protein [Qipengyuania sp. XHP0207]MDG5748598.1 hypothetical protein [Qipengyuania sp. XHP0207]